MDPSALSDLCPLPAYRERRARIFPSQGSMAWFVRKHKSELVRAGALVMISGQWFALEPRFDEVILEVGMDAAKRSRALHLGR